MTSKEFKKHFKNNFRRTSSFWSGLALMIVDAVMIWLCIGASFFLINLINTSFINFRSFITYWIYLPPILAVYYAAGLYPGIMLAPAEEVKKIGVCSFFCFAGIALSIIIENNEDKIAISIALLLAIPFAIVFIPVAREIMRHVFGHFKWWGVPAVMFLRNHSGDIILDRLLKSRDLGYMPAMILSDKAPEDAVVYKGIPVFNPSDNIFNLIKSLKIKVAIVCDYGGDLIDIRSRFRYTIVVPHYQDSNAMNMTLRDFGGILAISTINRLTKKFELFIKRLTDSCVSLLAAIVLSPLLLLLMFVVKVTSKGPVFYGHKRVGKNGKEFKCWKFRSMVIDADKQLEKILAENPEMRAEWEKDRKFTNDPRVTKIGKFLRKTSLDELPQLLNIFVGEMSLVGPRPVTEGELEKYGDKKDYVLSVTPGLSGMWQVSGRSETVYEERVTLDSYYVQNWSIWLDLWILVKTVGVVLNRKGAY